MKLQRNEGGTATLPASACRFVVAEGITFAAADPAEPGKRPKFRMLANSGKPIPNHGWLGALGINLAGVKWASDKMPVLLDHDTGRRLGYTTKLAVTDEGLIAEGVLLSNPDAVSVAQDSRDGFPWQASVYLRATKLLELGDGVEHVVNGHTMTGPGYVFEESELREVTFCALGADPNTSAAALADQVLGEVVVELTTKHQPMTAEPKPTNPPAPPVDNTALLASERAAERDRCNRILRAAAAEQAELRDKLIADGVPLADAMEQLACDARNRLSARLQAAAPATKPASAPSSESDPNAAAARALAALPEGVEKWKAEYAASAALRNEFGSESVWLAYRKNEARCKHYGSGEKFRQDTKDALPLDKA